MNEEEGKTQQRMRHRGPIKASYPRLGYDEIPAEQDHRSAGVHSLHLCEREKIDNNWDSSEISECAGTRTQEQEER